MNYSTSVFSCSPKNKHWISPWRPNRKHSLVHILIYIDSWETVKHLRFYLLGGPVMWSLHALCVWSSFPVVDPSGSGTWMDLFIEAEGSWRCREKRWTQGEAVSVVDCAARGQLISKYLAFGTRLSLVSLHTTSTQSRLSLYVISAIILHLHNVLWCISFTTCVYFQSTCCQFCRTLIYPHHRLTVTFQLLLPFKCPKIQFMPL